MAYSVWWVGSDGNVYQRSGDQVRNMGKALNASDNGYDAQFGSSDTSAGAHRIADPNPPRQNTPAPTAPNGVSSGGGGSAAPAKPDRSNDIAVQMAGLGSVDTQTNAGLDAIAKALGKLMGQYDTESTSNEKNYGDQSTTNQQNLQKGKQSALVNAAQGRQGLFGVLSSLGALNGSGVDLANRAVQKGANDDLSGASDTYSTNQQGLDTAIGTFRQEDKMRRDNANTAAENAQTNTRGQAAKSKMSFYSNIANDYSDMGDTGNAKKYTDLAASLYPEVAKSNIPNSDIAYTGAAFTPGTLANYIAGANNTLVSATPSQPGASTPGLVALPTKKKQATTV